MLQHKTQNYRQLFVVYSDTRVCCQYSAPGIPNVIIIHKFVRSIALCLKIPDMTKKVFFARLLTLLFLSLNSAVFASCTDQQQIPGIHPPTTLTKTPEWTITTDKKEYTVGEEATITFTSQIEKGWYMYSSDFDPNLGPIAAEFTFEKSKAYKTVGTITAVGSKKHYEEV